MFSNHGYTVTMAERRCGQLLQLLQILTLIDGDHYRPSSKYFPYIIPLSNVMQQSSISGIQHNSLNIISLISIF